MKFIYFTDIHLHEGRDSREGFERCLDSMLSHHPQVLINGGDLGIAPEALTLYDEITQSVAIPILHNNGNHELCNGYVPHENAGTAHTSVDINGVHLVILDVIRHFDPTQAHPHNWHVLADEEMLEWLAADLLTIGPQTPLFIASHVSLSTSFPFRYGMRPGMDFPTNEVANASKVLELLRPFQNVATLHGHDHENCRHYVEQIQIMTTAAVAGAWWDNGLNSRCSHGHEPQGYRLVEVDGSGLISSRYIAYVREQNQVAEFYFHTPSGRRFINVYDASPKTLVEETGSLGTLAAIDPLTNSSIGLNPHLYELPTDFDRQQLEIRIAFEDGRVYKMPIAASLQ